MHVLYAAGRRIARCVAAPQIYRALLVGACELTACSAATVYVLEHQTLLLYDGLAVPSDVPRQLEPSAAWLAQLHEQRVLAATDTADDPAAIVTFALTERDEAPPLVASAALLGGAGLRGALIVVWSADAARPAGWAACLAALAEDAGHALEQLEGEQRDPPLGTAAEAAILLAAVTAVTDIGLLYTNLIDRLLSALLAQILEVLQLGGGAIFLYNEESKQLELASRAWRIENSSGDAKPADLWAEPLLNYTHAQAQETARLGNPVLAADKPDGTSAGLYPLAEVLRQQNLPNLVSVPLLAGGWLTGVLQAVGSEGQRIEEPQLRTLRILARQAAVAIENARLFAQIRADQERTRAVVDATNDAILMLDERRRLMIVNRRARFFFGLTERDLLGKSFEQLSSLFGRLFEDGQRFTGWLVQLLRSESDRAVEEFPILRPEHRLLQCFSAPVMDTHDRYLGRILVFRDITREREVDRMKNDFVSIVSHELRTPLTSIQGALQLVLGQPRAGRPGMADGLAQRARDLLSISLSNTERLIRLINDILDIAKIEQGRIQLRREPLAPDELCRSAAAEVEAFANNRTISVELELSPLLPPVITDRDRSVQILVNLLSNAIKFSPSGQRVVLSARRDGQMVCFTVRDWGRGIAADQQARLFQKFQQLDSSATRDVGGTGLGLAISKALVEEQGGRIWLESEPARGSLFSFTLPIAPGADGVEQRPVQTRVLVAASDALQRDELCAACAAVGWDARPSADGAELLGLAGEAEAGLALLALPLSPDDATLLRQLRAAPGLIEAPLLVLADLVPELPRGVTVVPKATGLAQVIATAQRLYAERRPLVLVVDDDPYVRPVLMRLLQRHGLRVNEASDGYAALEAVARRPPDVILLDIRMPGLDGFEVLRRLSASQHSASIPVIILTANDLSETTRAQGLELGAKAYLEKPIAYERLVSTISGVLASEEGSG